MMNTIRQNYPSLQRKQQGMVVIIMSLLLLFSVSMLLLNIGKTSVMEQMISSNEYRAQEASQAAEAGIDFGLAWAGGNLPSWSAPGAVPATCYGDKETTAGFDQSASPSGIIPPITAASGDQYELTITYCRNSVNRSFFRVVATAVSTADGSVNKTLRVYSSPISSVLSPTFSGVPLIVDGCLKNVNGNPATIPFQVGDVVYETSQNLTQANGPPICAQPGNSVGLNLSGGTVKLDAFTHNDVWNYVFQQTPAQIQALSDAEIAAGTADADRYYFYYHNYGNNYHESHGAPDHPVIIVFDGSAGCPKINGNVTIYGVVFVNSPCPGASGWGGVDVWGSVVINGDADHLTANTRFRDWRTASTAVGPSPLFPTDSAPRLLGTWIDF